MQKDRPLVVMFLFIENVKFDCYKVHNRFLLLRSYFLSHIDINDINQPLYINI